MSFLVEWWNNYWYGSNHIDNFFNNGQLSTKEFTISGDHLTSICESWKWSPSLNPNYTFQDLDPNKQFLCCQNAICKHRIETVNHKQEKDQKLIVQKPNNNNQKQFDRGRQEQINEADIRYYNIYIIYDRKFHCPRIFFTANDTNGKSISNEDIKQDITKEYLEKTVVVEKFPFLQNASMFTFHPVKVAQVTKMFADTMKEDKQQVDCSIALVIFVKITTSILPLVQFDTTKPIEFSLSNR